MIHNIQQHMPGIECLKMSRWHLSCRNSRCSCAHVMLHLLAGHMCVFKQTLVLAYADMCICTSDHAFLDIFSHQIRTWRFVLSTKTNAHVCTWLVCNASFMFAVSIYILATMRLLLSKTGQKPWPAQHTRFQMCMRACIARYPYPCSQVKNTQPVVTRSNQRTRTTQARRDWRITGHETLGMAWRSLCQGMLLVLCLGCLWKAACII